MERIIFIYRGKEGMYQSIIVSTLLYEYEAWDLNVVMKKRLEAVEMSCLKAICNADILQRIQNIRIKR